ncbi:major facilitator superfamily domain-containing protein [Schizophyllum commune]
MTATTIDDRPREKGPATARATSDVPATPDVKERPPVEEKPSRYTRKETWFIVFVVAIAGLFSPLPANIYFPAIPTLTGVFHKSTSSLNLTVTVYLILQGISPMIWGPVSDFYGRRPTYLICLTILVLSCLGLALVPTDAFWLLLVLRCFQAAGCASTIALGAGVIGDISSRKDRGGYFGAFNLGPQLAPVIGPVLGGALADGLGWRSIFWFLCIFSGCCLLFVLVFLPETHHAVSASKNKAARIIYSPVIRVVGRAQHKAEKAGLAPPAQPSAPPKSKHIRNPLPLFLNPAVSLALTFTAIIYAVWYCVTATISSSFAEKYPFLSETDVGLCYLPIGSGMLISSAVHGRVLDAEYRRMRRRWTEEQKGDGEKGTLDERDFPIERARLRLMPLHVAVFAASVIGWGWSVQAGAHLAAPLVLQLPIGYTFNAVLNTTMTLMIDIEHAQSSSVTACTNLARCSLAAIMTAVIDYITNGLGYGWTYVLFGGVAALMIPFIYLEMIMGPRWRARREAKKAGA